MENPFTHWLFMLASLISSLAAINAGLLPFGYNLFQSDFVLMNMATLIPLFHYIILASGIISFACFILCVSGAHCHSECHSKCK